MLTCNSFEQIKESSFYNQHMVGRCDARVRNAMKFCPYGLHVLVTVFFLFFPQLY